MFEQIISVAGSRGAVVELADDFYNKLERLNV